MRGLAASLLIHAGVIAAGAIYLPRAVPEYDTNPVLFEVFDAGVLDSRRAAAPEPVEEPEVAEEEEPTLEDEIVDPQPAPPPPEPEPEIQPELIDLEPEPAPEETPVEPQEPEIEPEPEPEPEPVREEPRIVQPETPQRSEPSLADLLGDIEREVNDARNDAGTPDIGDERSAVGSGETNTATLQTMLESHLARCWRASLDAPHPEELAVQVDLVLSRTGELLEPPRLHDQNRVLNSPNPYLRVAGERALRAATTCAPYPLPPELYSEWRQITANFAPSLYDQ